MAGRPEGEAARSGLTGPRKRRRDAATVIADTASHVDERMHKAGPLKEGINKVFPKHWSFMLGEIPLYSFIILVITGTFLTFFYDPSMTEVRYHGAYRPLDNVPMSDAFSSTLRISFDVRSGLFIRQVHHWAALLFIASIFVHLVRNFFTGAFRKPREATWIGGVLLLWISLVEGYLGYSLPDDNLSGMGVRIGSGILLSIPIVGTWLQFLVFGGEYPGHNVFIERFYIGHVLLIPGIILAMIALHVGLVVVQKHTQFAGPRQTEKNVVGERLLPAYSIKSGALFMGIFGGLALLGGLVQINPIWLWGPTKASVGALDAQPDWYIGFLEGSLRIFPPWEAHMRHYTLASPFWPAVFLPVVMFVLMIAYPFIEQRLTRDRALHNILQRPRDAPVRTAVGVAAIAFYAVLMFAGGDDVISDVLRINLNALVQIFRILIFVLPAVAYILTYYICRQLQRDDITGADRGLNFGALQRQHSGALAHQQRTGSPTVSPVPAAPHEPPTPR